MSEINLGQFLKNAFNYSTGQAPMKQAGQVGNGNFQNTQNQVMQQLNKTMQNITQNFLTQQDIMNTQMQLKALTNLEKTMLLKSLFNFPDNIQDIAKFLATENKALTEKELQLLLTQPIDMSKLLVLLQTNGKTAIEKIAKMIATMNQSGIYNTQQLKEMTTLINACIPANDASATQILKSFMIMYLPWLPLNSAMEFNIESEIGEEKKITNDEDMVTIFITTKSYGLIKILIYKDEGAYNIDINCQENFPKEKFNTEIKNKSEDASLNIKNSVAYTTRKTQEIYKNEEPKVDFSKSAKISPQLLIVIHSIIKIIMDIDAQGCLENKREQEL